MSQITQSVIATNPNCHQNPKFDGLISLRRNPNTFDLIGRLNGNNIKFDTGLSSSYNDLKMRRKAEILQYKNTINTNSPGYERTSSQIYKDVINGVGPNSYSKYKLLTLNESNNESINCNTVVGNPPSNSGIHFNDTSEESKDGLYLDKNVRFYLSL